MLQRHFIFWTGSLEYRHECLLYNNNLYIFEIGALKFAYRNSCLKMKPAVCGKGTDRTAVIRSVREV